MGAAIGVFEGAAALRVPRSRFVPVKTTNDLLSLRSDAYVIGEGRAVDLAPERDGVPPFVDLDSDHYKLVGDFDARFGAGPPSLVGVRGAARRGRRALRRRRRRARRRDGSRASMPCPTAQILEG